MTGKPWYESVISGIGSLFGGGSSSSSSSSAPTTSTSNSSGGFDFASLIQPAFSTIWSIYSGKKQIDAQQNALDAQQNALAQAQALKQQQFEAEMAYKYAALAAKGGGGGGGGAAAALARQQLELQKKQLNDNNFFEREKLRLASQNAKSEAYRSFVSGMLGAYK